MVKKFGFVVTTFLSFLAHCRLLVLVFVNLLPRFALPTLRQKLRSSLGVVTLNLPAGEAGLIQGLIFKVYFFKFSMRFRVEHGMMQ